MLTNILLSILESAILRYQIGQELFEKIDRGDIHELSLDILEGFLLCYPREKEVEALHTAVERFGIYDFREAL